MPNPTPEQQAIISAAQNSQNSVLIRALAGTGKTSTLVMLAESLRLQSPALAIAFNVSAVEELRERFPSGWKIQTLNSLGNDAWKATLGRWPKVNSKKLGTLVSETLAGHSTQKSDWQSVRELVTLAMNAGLVPSSFPLYTKNSLLPDNDDSWLTLAQNIEDFSGDYIISFAQEVLTNSIKKSFSGEISYDDQIYMPTFFGGKFPQYSLVMVDECQDLSVSNRLMVQRLASGRIILVGDQNQAIYGFRGADTNSINSLKSLRDDFLELPLTMTFRCPKTIVERQHSLVPDYRAHPNNPQGKFVSLCFEPKWHWDNIASIAQDRQIAVLCRNNAPLITLAFKLLKQSIPVNYLGRDIGKNLKSLSKKILPKDYTPAAQCSSMISEWKTKQVALAKANKQEYKIESIEDRANCLLAVLESSRPIKDSGDLRKTLDYLFEQPDKGVVLSTGHKCKGMQFPVVLHLDPWRIPSKLVEHNPELLQQEYNLKYVIETRTMEVLIEANLKRFE